MPGLQRFQEIEPEGSGREGGGREIRMGNTCKSMADSCQCMAKTSLQLIKINEKKKKKTYLAKTMDNGGLEKIY